MCDFVNKVILNSKYFTFVYLVQTEKKRKLLKSLLGGLRVVAFSINTYKASIFLSDIGKQCKTR